MQKFRRSKITLFFLLFLTTPLAHAQYYTYESNGKKTLRALERFVHTIDIDGVIEQMKRNGVTQKRFMTGISVSGSVFTWQPPTPFSYAPAPLPLAYGSHVLTYSMTLLADQTYQLKVGLLSIDEMNEVTRIAQDKRVGSLYIDHAEVVTASFDNTNYAKTRTLEVTVFEVEPTVPLYRGQHAYFTLRGKFKVSGMIQELPVDGKDPIIFSSDQGAPASLENPDHRDFAMAEVGALGLEWGTRNDRGTRMKLKAMYENGWQGVENGRYVEPLTGICYNGRRDYTYIRLLADFSKTVAHSHSNRPIDLGAQIQGNMGIKDQFKGDGGTQLQLMQYSSPFQIKFYIRF